MKVSIHCQGCAGKVRKHLSKMEGISFLKICLELVLVNKIDQNMNRLIKIGPLGLICQIISMRLI